MKAMRESVFIIITMTRMWSERKGIYSYFRVLMNFYRRDLGKLSYVNENNELFLLFAQNLYKVNIEENSSEILEEGIKNTNFVVFG